MVIDFWPRRKGIGSKRFVGFYDSWGFRIWLCMFQLLEIKGLQGKEKVRLAWKEGRKKRKFFFTDSSLQLKRK
jgi:hypothetical protein